MAAEVMSQGPLMGGYGRYGDYWAYRALGAGMNSREQRPMTLRADVTRGQLTPAADDPSALAATGEDPTVLAFALGSCGGRVVFEVLNQPERLTYVYRADGPGGLAAINRALDDAGFQAAAVHAEGLAAAAVPGAAGLAAALAGQVAHDGQWAAGLAELLS
jgi:hypothetical protein